MKLTPEVEDALDFHEASSELLELWATRQEQLNEVAAAKPGKEPLPEPVRAHCLKYVGMLVRLSDESEKAWFEQAAMFDFYCVRSKMSEEELIAQAPASCTAIVRMCAKLDAVTTGRRRLGLSRHASQLTDALGRLGHRVDTCTEESINDAETKILEVLDWDLRVPSLEMWTSFLCRRFNVITRGMFDQSLLWVQGQSQFLARIVVLRSRHGAFCTRRMAEGIVAFALVSAGLIPGHILRPQAMDYSAEEWQDLLRSCQPTGVLPACNVEESRVNLLLQILTVVNGKNAESIRESCALACETVRGAVQVAGQHKATIARA